MEPIPVLDPASLISCNIDKLLEVPGLAIMMADLEGQLFYCNRPSCELLGYRRQELLQKNIRDLTPAAYFEWEKPQVLRSIQKGQNGLHLPNKPLIKKDGETILVSTHLIILDLPDQGAVIMGVIVPNSLDCPKPLPESLTPMERRLAKMTAYGMTIKEMAAALKLSARTIENHRYNIKRKLNLPDKMNLYQGLKLYDLD
jgi:PAS domain S-box-containing protein